MRVNCPERNNNIFYIMLINELSSVFRVITVINLLLTAFLCMWFLQIYDLSAVFADNWPCFCNFIDEVDKIG